MATDPATFRSPTDIELLAPAGDWECVKAAVANGADAVYFGLPAFNARIRATNFSEDNLPDLMAYLHRHGVRGFAAFNTLIFSKELEAAARQLLLLDRADVDAIIVQDLGLARLARELAPRLELHASTQMTITSPEGLAFVDRHFRLDRAVIARENSLREIRLYHAEKPDAVSLETFVHGALCVAYSGQCLTSESLGQRSANRGECAQACRMPYELVVDGEPRNLGDKRYLLSPQDLAGHQEIPELIRLGVRSFKIEGRLKTPEYVAAVTRVYRKAIDAALADAPSPVTDQDRYELEMTFSRGLSTGWLRGIDNQELVHARFGKKRGAFLGEVTGSGRDWVELQDVGAVRAGDGIVFDTGGDPDREVGGRVFEVRERRIFLARGNGSDLRAVPVGARVWKTDDPHLAADLRATWSAGRFEPVRGQRAVRWRVRGRVGDPLELQDAETGCAVTSAMALEPASRRPLDRAFLEAQLGRMGGSGCWLEGVDLDLEGDLLLPVSELNRMRRALLAQVDEAREAKPKRIEVEPDGKAWMPERTTEDGTTGEPELRVLCRTGEQIEAVIAEGVSLVYADFEDVREYRDLVCRFRKESRNEARLFLATPRIQKPGEMGLFKVVERAQPDGVLVRNLGGAGYFQGTGLPRVADFSLNVANPLTAAFLMEQGFENLTISYDLNAEQVTDLLALATPAWFELTVHQHMPMFHMEHCVFCAFLSKGTDVTNCGKPCQRHDVRLRDRVGQLHVLQADVGCRNTLFNGRAQTGARHVPGFLAAGLKRFRVELLREDGRRTREVLKSYQQLLRGEVGGEDFWKRLGATSKLGVTEGTLAG